MKSYQETNYRRYIPVKIYNELFPLDYPRKENLYTILDLVYSINEIFKDDTQKKYGYSQLSSKLIQSKLYGISTEMKSDMDWLINQGYIERNDSYHVEAGRSKGYRIAAKYLSKPVGVPITNKTLVKKIKQEIVEMRKWKDARFKLQRTKYYDNFKLRIDDALHYILDKAVTELINLSKVAQYKITNREAEEIIKNNKYYDVLVDKLTEKYRYEFNCIMHRYVNYSVKINRIKDGFLFFKRNKTNNRLDSNLTTLPSDLRQFIDSKEELVSIDFRSSQAFMLYTDLKDDDSIDEGELEVWKELVISGGTAGDFYDYLCNHYHKRTGKEVTRDKMKTVVCSILYSKNHQFKPEKEFFSSVFPTINSYIIKRKESDYTDLSIELMGKESYTNIDVIVKRLEEKGIVPYTIHDSFVCTVDESATVINMIEDTLNEMYGCSVKLHVESINRVIETAPAILEDDDFIIDYIDTRIEDIPVESIQLPRYSIEEIKSSIKNIIL